MYLCCSYKIRDVYFFFLNGYWTGLHNYQKHCRAMLPESSATSSFQVHNMSSKGTMLISSGTSLPFQIRQMQIGVCVCENRLKCTLYN